MNEYTGFNYSFLLKKRGRGLFRIRNAIGNIYAQRAGHPVAYLNRKSEIGGGGGSGRGGDGSGGLNGYGGGE